MSKGSRQHPTSISNQEYASRWDAIFGKDISSNSCSCGRSPTGQCLGWHKLTENEFQEKLVEYKSTNNIL